MFDNGVAFYVNDRDFIPTTQDLLGIAQVIQEVGVIDEKSRRDLENEIEKYSRGEYQCSAYIKTKENWLIINIPYVISGPRGFPFFESKYYEPSHSLPRAYPFIGEEEVIKRRNSGVLDGQEFRIYKEETYMGEDAGPTHFSIADLNIEYKGDWMSNISTRIRTNPVLVELRSRLDTFLGMKTKCDV